MKVLLLSSPKTLLAFSSLCSLKSQKVNDRNNLLFLSSKNNFFDSFGFSAMFEMINECSLKLATKIYRAEKNYKKI